MNKYSYTEGEVTIYIEVERSTPTPDEPKYDDAYDVTLLSSFDRHKFEITVDAKGDAMSRTTGKGSELFHVCRGAIRSLVKKESRNRRAATEMKPSSKDNAVAKKVHKEVTGKKSPNADVYVDWQTKMQDKGYGKHLKSDQDTNDWFMGWFDELKLPHGGKFPAPKKQWWKLGAKESRIAALQTKIAHLEYKLGKPTASKVKKVAVKVLTAGDGRSVLRAKPRTPKIDAWLRNLTNPSPKKVLEVISYAIAEFHDEYTMGPIKSLKAAEMLREDVQHQLSILGLGNMDHRKNFVGAGIAKDLQNWFNAAYPHWPSIKTAGKFELGRVVQTRGVNHKSRENPQFKRDVDNAFRKYMRGDWGISKDKRMNNQAVKNGDDRIMGVYKTSEGDIWIITEWDRSVTTMLFPNEY